MQKLNSWIPQYNSFQAQLEPFKQQIRETEEYNQSLHRRIDDQSWAVQGHKVRADDLQRQLWAYQEFIESIPEDLRAELRQRYERMQKLGQSQEFEQGFYE